METARFEQNVLRGGMWLARRKSGIKGKKRKKSLPEEFPISIVLPDGTTQVMNVGLEDYPVSVVTPVYWYPPNFLGQWEATTTIPIAHFAMLTEGTRIRGTFSADYHLDIKAYSRMLCKIAHGIAIHAIGLDGFSPILPDVILGRTQEFDRYIGTLPSLEDHTDFLHVLSLGFFTHHATLDPPRYGYVQIRLFARHDTPTHRVMFGQINDLGMERIGQQLSKIGDYPTQRPLTECADAWDTDWDWAAD